MRIGLVSPYALSSIGGVQGQVVGLAVSLRRRGHDVAVAAPALTGPVAAALADQGVSLIDAGKVVRIPANGSVAPISLNPRAAIKVRRHFLQWRADVIHCHEPLAPLLSYALVLMPPAPLVATYHRAGGGPFMGLLKPIRPLFGRRISQSFAVSNAAKEFAAKVTTANPTVLFNGIDLSAVDRATPRDLGVSAVVFIGRHEERKGLQVLLEAHEMLGSGVLSIAGAGPQTDDLRERFPESSSRHWLGVVSDDEKYALLRGAAVTCAPALGGESFGIIVLEALAASSIAVVSALDGYREAAAGHAIEVAPGDVRGLADALGHALTAAATGEGEGGVEAKIAARAHAEAWSLDHLAQIYEGAYLDVTGSRR